MHRIQVFVFCAGMLASILVTDAAEASVAISADPTSNMSCSSGVCSPTAKKAVLNVTDLTNMLASEDVKIVTGAGAVTITTFAPFSWTSTHRLTLDAYESVTFRAPVTVAGTGAVAIVTNDGGTGGDLIFFPGAKLDFWDTSSSGLLINSIPYTLVPSLFAARRALHANPAGSYALAQDSSKRIEWRKGIREIKGTLEGLGHSVRNLSTWPAFIRDNYGTVRDINLVDAEITTAGGFALGVLIAQNFGSVLRSSVSGQISIIKGAGFAQYVGGLIGANVGTIHASSSAVTLNAPDMQFSGCYVCGGLVGINFDSGTIDESFATGVWATGVGSSLGGLAGAEFGTTLNSYTKAAVSSTGAGEEQIATGGAFGTAEGTKKAIYAVGSVKGTTGEIGGFVGADTGATFNNVYWDMEATGITNPHRGAGNTPDDPGITGLTDAQLKAGLPAGFEPAIWGQSPSINDGYPYLLANPPPQ